MKRSGGRLKNIKESDSVSVCLHAESMSPNTYNTSENERVRLRDQIEELKFSLEQAQLHRKRKMEYDLIAEKINALPSREELEECVSTAFFLVASSL